MKIYRQNTHAPVFQVADNGFVLEINAADGWLTIYDPQGEVIDSAHTNSYDLCGHLRTRFAELHSEGVVNIHPDQRIEERFDPRRSRLEDAGRNRFNYMLLSRLQQDCDYYLGAGNRLQKHLWAGNEVGQIGKMKELYDSLNEKPEWITPEDIARYEAAMISDSDKDHADAMPGNRMKL